MYLEVDMEDVAITLGSSIPHICWVMFESNGQSVVFQFDDAVKRKAFLQAIKKVLRRDHV